MAPRRKTPKVKVGLRRIDAAFDALRPMGFPDNVVRQTIRNLLKAYGGDDGWSFIEEYSYQLVIDTILQESADTEQANLEESEQDCSQKNGNVEDEPGKQLCPSPAHSPQIHTAPTQSPSLTCPSSAMDNMPKSSTGETSQGNVQIQSHSLTCPSPGMDNMFKSSTDETSQDMVARHVSSPQSSSVGVPLCTQSPSRLDSRPIRIRKPCYGWISSDDDEDDLVYLKPAYGSRRG